MRKIVYALLAIVLLASCSSGETYGDKKEKERNAISDFIKEQGIKVIDEATFREQDSTTNLASNEYVFLTSSGVYMQIIRKGGGTPIEEGKSVNVLCRYIEYDILNKTVLSNNVSSDAVHYYDKMVVSRTGSTYTASFVSGKMMQTYGSSSSTTTAVPAGWIVPLQYVNLGRRQDEVAKVVVIVPHSQGTTYANSNVTPCLYEITYQREK